MGAPPADVRRDLQRLSKALDAQIPTKDESNLLIATWNLRAFGGLTAKWQSAAGDTPKRDQHAVACIAALVSRFDVVAVQEVRRDTTALRFLLDQLPGWHVIASDVTEGGRGTANGGRSSTTARGCSHPAGRCWALIQRGWWLIARPCPPTRRSECHSSPRCTQPPAHNDERRPQ